MSGSEEGKSQEILIIRRRGGEGEQGHHGGVWKIAYADFMTAMMAFFLVMWLVNSTDKKTLTQVATYFNPMRLTDKKPTPKGLEEPDGTEGKETSTQKGAAQKGPKKKEGEAKGEAKGAKKAEIEAEDAHGGEVRPRGKPFQRDVEDVDKKVANERGATAGESPRQGGGRAFRDPFDSVQRTEIVPSDPAMARIERATPRATAPAGSEGERRAPLDGKRADLAEPALAGPAATKRAEPAGPSPDPSGEAGRADLAEPARGRAAGTKRAEPAEPSPAPSGEARRADLIDPPGPSLAGAEAKRTEVMGPSSGASPESPRADRTDPPQAIVADAKRVEPADVQPPAVADAKAVLRSPSKGAADRADAERLEEDIKQAVGEALPGILPHIDVTVTPDGVLISLTDDFDFGMFAVGSAEPRPAMTVVMEKVAKILQTRTEPLIVRGHTDRRRYRTAAYDNWRLSAARAHMAYVMLARSGVEEKRFERIEGHADRNLRVELDPEAAQNRRIEILLRKPAP